MFAQLQLEAIEPNPFNPRLKYPSSKISRLSRSLESIGQLSPIKVRPSPRGNGKYELIFGHRRFLAAKQAGWKTIRAEVVNVSDEELMTHALVENVEHEDLSDFEKAMIFDRVHREFQKTYREIGQLVGLTTAAVSNYIAMLRLFDKLELEADPVLYEAMHQLSEHHSRILSRIEDRQMRSKLAKMTMNEHYTVKELANIIGRLRSWFFDSECHTLSLEGAVAEFSCASPERVVTDEEKIKQTIMEEFKLARQGDFERYEKIHLFEDGYSLYSAFPPFERFEDEKALSKERTWFFKIAPKVSWDIGDFKIRVMKDSALATLTLRYYNSGSKNHFDMKTRGSIVLVKNKDSWRILHEHWSSLRNESSMVGISLPSEPFL